MRGTTLLALAPIIPAVLQACSSGGGDDGGGGGQACDGNFAVSSVDDMHNHNVCIPTADLVNPPAAGATYVSSNDGEHTHKITLTAAQLSSIQAGSEVTVVSTSDVDPLDGADHTHTWKISKAAATPKPPVPTGW